MIADEIKVLYINYLVGGKVGGDDRYKRINKIYYRMFDAFTLIPAIESADEFNKKYRTYTNPIKPIPRN